MNIESKIWHYSCTGTKLHAFKDGVALCRPSIRRPGAERDALDYCEVKGWSLCTACENKFNAAIESAEENQPQEEVYVNHLSDVEVGDLRTDSRGLDYRVDDIKVSRDRSGAYIRVSGRCVGDTWDGIATTYGAYCYELAYDTVLEETKEEATVTSTDIAPEVIEALATLREFARNSSLTELDEALAIDVLDNAGIFAAIDEATGYDINPEPVRVSRCTCPPKLVLREGHLDNCPEAQVSAGGVSPHKALCGIGDKYGNPCYLNLGHSHDCLH